jgi:hypothetical protein
VTEIAAGKDLVRWLSTTALTIAAFLHLRASSSRRRLVFLGFGLSDPKQGLFGILPELIGL